MEEKDTRENGQKIRGVNMEYVNWVIEIDIKDNG